MANEEETKMADFKLGLRNKVRVQIQHGGLGSKTQIKLGLDPLRDLGFNPLRGFPIVLGLCINLLIVTHITTLDIFHQQLYFYVFAIQLPSIEVCLGL